VSLPRSEIAINWPSLDMNLNSGDSAHQFRGTLPTGRLFKEIGRRVARKSAGASAHERLSVCCQTTMPREDEDKRSLSPLILDDSLSSSSHLDSPRFSPVRFTSRRRRIVVTAVAVFSVFSLLVLAYLSSSRPLVVSQDPAPAPALSLNHTPSLDRKSALLGPPTSRFRGLPL
jgi:hypothetical protein